MKRVSLFASAGFGWMTLALGAALAGTPLPNSAALSGTVAYLRQNCEPLDLRKAKPEASLLKTSGQKIFLLGEVHGVAVNNRVDLMLLEYLHRVAGVRVYLSEMSYAHAWYINRFLTTGDTAALDFAFSQMHGFVDYSREKRRFWIELRQWNESLPPAGRVRVVGIDLERMPGISLAFLRAQLEGKSIPADLRPVVDRLLAAPAKPSPARIRALTAELSRSVAAHEAEYAAALGDHWFGFALAVDNLADHDRCAADKAHYDYLRDRIMYRNFCRQVAQTPFAAAYGRLGRDHVLQHRSAGVDHLSALLNAPGSPWAGRVTGIWPLYRAAVRLAFVRGRYGCADCSDAAALTAPFAETAPQPIVLFKLTGAGSPFARRLILPPGADEGVTTDYFQYVLLLNGAGADTPLDAAALATPR